MEEERKEDGEEERERRRGQGKMVEKEYTMYCLSLVIK